MKQTSETSAAQTAASVGHAGRQRCGPIIVVTYAHAGADLLREALSSDPALVCTSGTGVLPLCQAAVATWRVVEGRDVLAPSALAISSVRALASSMITIITAGSGASRWCETSVAAPEAAEAFLQVFPSAAFACMHRGLAGVLADGMKAHPWGLGNSPFWQFAGPYPGNSIAVIAAYWAACTELLLDFQERHPDRCIRVTYEDLANDKGRVAKAVFEFFGLDAGVLSEPHSPQQVLVGERHDPDLAAQLARLPRGLLAKADELHGRLALPWERLASVQGVRDFP